MKKNLVIISTLLLLLGCGGSSGGSDTQAQIDPQDIHDNLCLELGCSFGCVIYTGEDPDGAGTIQWCEDVED